MPTWTSLTRPCWPPPTPAAPMCWKRSRLNWSLAAQRPASKAATSASAPAPRLWRSWSSPATLCWSPTGTRPRCAPSTAAHRPSLSAAAPRCRAPSCDGTRGSVSASAAPAIRHNAAAKGETQPADFRPHGLKNSGQRASELSGRNQRLLPWRIIFGMPPATVFIILRVSSNCLSSRLTS